jgi:hypothetical protein
MRLQKMSDDRETNAKTSEKKAGEKWEWKKKQCTQLQ